MNRLWMALCGLLLWAGAAQAQEGSEADVDSTAANTGSSLADIGQMSQAQRDSIRQAMENADVLSDSLVLEAPFFWLANPSLVLSADIRADVSSVSRTGSAVANADLLGGYSARTSYTFNDVSYRQQDRDSQRETLDASLSGENPITAVDLSFRGLRSEDVTTLITTGDDIVIENDDARASLKLDGKKRLPGDIKWVLAGEIEDVQGVSRGTNNDRQLAEGGVTTRWNRLLRPDLTVSARAGLNRAVGDRQLRGQKDDATTSNDTVGAQVVFDRGAPGRVSVDVERAWFDEERLDFRRSASGVIDTLNAPPGVDLVGRENEIRRSDRIGVSADSRLLPVLGVATRYDHDRSETTYSFSQQGLIQRGSDRVSVDLDFRYAEAGSLSAEYAWGDSWNDRKTRGDTFFRGRESRRSQEVGLELKQKLFRETDLDVQFSQRLSQSIYEAAGNQNDRDQLVERIGAELRTKAIPRVTMNLGGTASRTDIVSIASERVGNNKEDRLYEVRGSYTLQATDRLTVDQTMKMQIVFNDFHNSNDRDQFNKQGQMTAGASYTLRPGTAFTLDYSADFRSTGRRVETGERGSVAYQTTLRSTDHQVRGSLTFPISFFKVTLNSSRGFLRRENPSLGTDTPEDRGEFRGIVAGSRSFFGDRLEFRVDVQRVLAFGPRVREENDDYWIANSGMSWTF